MQNVYSYYNIQRFLVRFIHIELSHTNNKLYYSRKTLLIKQQIQIIILEYYLVLVSNVKIGPKM